MMRIATIVVDARHLERYRAALKEGIEAAVLLEPDVRALFAVSEVEDPTRFTVLEIYADQAAYESHIKTPHFLKYKTETQDMVVSLSLADVVPLVPQTKFE